MASSALLASAVALTTSLTASTDISNTEGLAKHTFLVEWTPGTAANVLTLAIDFRFGTSAGSGGEWTQEQTWDESATAGTYTRTLKQYQHTAANTSVVPIVISTEGHASAIRIRYAESEAGSSTKGTITARAISSKT